MPETIGDPYLCRPVIEKYISYQDLLLMSFEDFLDLQEMINLKEYIKSKSMSALTEGLGELL